MDEIPKDINYNDNKVLDALSLNKAQIRIGLAKFIIFTLIAILIFFVPITIAGKTDIIFGIIYRTIQDVLGIFGIWLIMGGVVVGNAFASIYGKLVCKDTENVVYQYYEEDSIIHIFLYVLSGIFSLCYLLNITFDMAMPEFIVGEHIAGAVIPVALSVSWIIPVSALFMPFLLNYGSIDFIGSLMEPIMRFAFKVPGRSAVNAIASFVSSSSVGVLITSKLFRSGVYTKKEAAIIATGFSAVSVGFAYMVIETAGLAEYFISIYFSTMVITVFVNFFMCRIPPLSRQPSVYADGREQKTEDIENDVKFTKSMFTEGVNRAIKKAYVAPKLVKEMGSSLLDGYYVLPKVVSLLTAVGMLAMMLATYTPLFKWLGLLFQPLLMLLQVPDAAAIAPSLPVGIAEMFLPVLMIADQVDVLSEGARYMVVAVSMVQIIFFSETVVVMISTKIPISLGQLVVCFFERTLLAIPISAAFMHLMF